MCVCVCVRGCVRACVCGCMCVHACVTFEYYILEVALNYNVLPYMMLAFLQQFMNYKIPSWILAIFSAFLHLVLNVVAT